MTFSQVKVAKSNTEFAWRSLEVIKSSANFDDPAIVEPYFTVMKCRRVPNFKVYVVFH